MKRDELFDFLEANKHTANYVPTILKVDDVWITVNVKQNAFVADSPLVKLFELEVTDGEPVMLLNCQRNLYHGGLKTMVDIARKMGFNVTEEHEPKKSTEVTEETNSTE